MVADEAVLQLREEGVVLLHDVFPPRFLTILKDAAARCFEAIHTGKPIPACYQFNRFSHSVVLAALNDFGCTTEDLVAPLSAPRLEPLFSKTVGRKWTCNMHQSWVRKRFAPFQASSLDYCPNSWHQDGALGVDFPVEPGPAIPMTELLTCWIPLNRCGRDSPGLEFVRGCQGALLHFTELDDPALRRRFALGNFWVPQLEFGDTLVFLNSVLHRTYTHPRMAHDRLSVEYRIFPV